MYVFDVSGPQQSITGDIAFQPLPVIMRRSAAPCLRHIAIAVVNTLVLYISDYWPIVFTFLIFQGPSSLSLGLLCSSNCSGPRSCYIPI